jgi:phosphatidylglycerophosphate synthase
MLHRIWPVQATSFRDSLRNLKSVQKTSRGAPIYSLVINRPLGRFFAAGAHQLGLTPNQVTIISAVFTFSGIAALAALEPGVPTALLVTVALVLGYELDASDGQLARLQGGGGVSGEWLDHSVDSVKIATLHLAVLIMAYRTFDVPELWLLVPLAFTAAYVVHFFGMLLTDLLTRVRVAQTGSPAVMTASSRLLSVLKLPTDYGFLCLSFLLLAVPSAFVVVYTAFAAAMIGYTALVLPRWYGRLKRLE